MRIQGIILFLVGILRDVKKHDLISFSAISPGGGGNAIYVPYGDVPPIRVYFLAFESETGCLFSSLTLKLGAKFVRSLQARVPTHSTVWHPPVGFNLFVFCPGN